jgi:hypothetical protein
MMWNTFYVTMIVVVVVGVWLMLFKDDDDFWGDA